MKKVALQNAALTPYRAIWHQVIAEIGAGRSPEDQLVQLSATLRDLRQTVTEAEKLYDIAVAAASAAGGKPPAPSTPAQPHAKLKKLHSKSARSNAIRSAAAVLASRNGGRIDIKGVAEAVAANGFNLDTKVPGTMIGNVLNKSSDWKRLHKGAYEHVGQN